MAIPNYDALSVQHSKNISDPVASATTDGKTWSSAQRDYHLNTAIRMWMDKVVSLASKVERSGSDAVILWELLRGYITEGSNNLVANVVALSSYSSAGCYHILSAYDTTLSKPIKKLPAHLRFQVESGGNSYLTASATNLYWTDDGGNLRVLGAGATDAIKLRYVPNHTALAANTGSTDIAVPPQNWRQVLDLATDIAMRESAQQSQNDQIVNAELQTNA